MAKKRTKKNAPEFSDAEYERLESVLNGIHDDQEMTFDDFKEYLLSEGIESGESIFDRMKDLAEDLEFEDDDDEERYAEDSDAPNSLPPHARLVCLLALNRRCKPMLELRAKEWQLRKLANEYEQKFERDLGAGAMMHPLESIATGALTSLRALYTLAISGGDHMLEAATMKMSRYLAIERFSAVPAEIFDYDDERIERSIDDFIDAQAVREDHSLRKLHGVIENELKDPKLICQILKYAVSRRCNIPSEMFHTKKLLAHS